MAFVARFGFRVGLANPELRVVWISTTLKLGRKYAGSSTGTPRKNQLMPDFSRSAFRKVPMADIATIGHGCLEIY
jgi:hypothetical protein